MAACWSSPGRWCWRDPNRWRDGGNSSDPEPEASFIVVQWRLTTTWQTVCVWLLFLASVGTLLFNSVTAFLLPGQEHSVATRLRDAARKLVLVSESVVDRIPLGDGSLSPALKDELEQRTANVLRHYPGVEGGFYIDINREHEEFAGFAVSSQLRGQNLPPLPREQPYIRQQVRHSAVQEGADVLVQSHDLGPSVVVVATAPVDKQRPAHVVVWLMFRVTGPEQQRTQLFRYRISTVLAIGGMTLAIVLTLNLRQTLRKERAAQETLRDELRRSEHLASLGLLLAQVAHEVRNPLAGIRSTVQLWQRLPDLARTPESLQAVLAAVDRLDSLLSQLLCFSRSDHAGREAVDVNALLRETVELLRAQAVSQNVQLELELDPQLPHVLGSPSALRQVVLNLATNALQAMPSHGRLVCRTVFRKSERLVELQIADNGPGISPDVRARLFEPFFTTRPEGTGLGLALCREIVIQHHGRIELDSLQPQGTLCRVLLPMHNGDASEPRLAHTPTEHIPAAGTAP